MKYLLSILCLFIVSCDKDSPPTGSGNDNGDEDNSEIIQVQDFVFPLAVGNTWTYEYTHTRIYTCDEPPCAQNATSNEEIPDESQGTATLNLTITDLVELSTGITAYKMIYSFVIEENSDGVIYHSEIGNYVYYINNTEDGLYIYANDRRGLDFALPKLDNSNYSNIYNIINNPFNVFGPIILNRDGDCQYFWEPPVERLKYPILLDDSWDVINDNHILHKICDESEEYIEHIQFPITRKVDNINYNGCFNIKSDMDATWITDDSVFEHNYVYCNNIGLEEILWDYSFSCSVGGEYSNSEVVENNHIEVKLIDFNIEN